jgi:hypothetical protein
VNRCRQNRSEAIWARALKKAIVHAPPTQPAHIHPSVSPIVQRKRAPSAAYKRACAEEYSALTTRYCLLRGVFWGADFTQTKNGLCGEHARRKGAIPSLRTSSGWLAVTSANPCSAYRRNCWRSNRLQLTGARACLRNDWPCAKPTQSARP